MCHRQSAGNAVATARYDCIIRRLPAPFWLDLAAKAALVGLLVFALARPDLPQFAGKAMAGRAIGYPLATLVVPAIWWAVNRRRRTSYPFALDVLITLRS